MQIKGLFQRVKKEPPKQQKEIIPLPENPTVWGHIQSLTVKLAELTVRVDGLQALLTAETPGRKERTLSGLGRAVAGLQTRKGGRQSETILQPGDPTITPP